MTNWNDEPSELDLVYEELLEAEKEMRFLRHANCVMVELYADAILEINRLKRLIEEWNR